MKKLSQKISQQKCHSTDAKLKLDYYYGRQGERNSFYAVPKALCEEMDFMGLSNDAKLLYAVLLDRNARSLKSNEENGTFLDQCNRTFIYFSIEAIMRKLGCAEQKAVKLMRELENYGLIEKRRQGLGKNNIIYVKDIFTLRRFMNPNAEPEL